jgi:hypothetical protein
MRVWNRPAVGAAVAGLCLLGVLGVVAAASADDAPSPHATGSAYVACAALDLSVASPGAPVTATAVMGSTTATLEGTTADAWGIPAIGSPTLTIGDGDATVRSGPVDVPDEWDGPQATIIPTGIALPAAAPAAADDAMLPLCVARFAGNDRPTVLLGFFTGGAHCCTVLRAYPLPATGAGAGVDEWIGNPGVDVRPEGDHAIVATADDAFNYEFNAYAFSGVPVKVLEFRKSAFVDTTHEHLAFVRSDAAVWWESFSANPPQGLGSLAAWVADQCLLDEGPSAWGTIDRLLTEGKLSGDPNAGDLWPSGADYVAKLHAFLPQHGYCR